MLLKWKRNAQGDYASTAQYWDRTPLYVIGRIVTNRRGGKRDVSWGFTQRDDRKPNRFKTLQEAKRHAQEVENKSDQQITVRTKAGKIETWRKVGDYV